MACRLKSLIASVLAMCCAVAVLLLACPHFAYAYVEGDQTPLDEEQALQLVLEDGLFDETTGNQANAISSFSSSAEFFQEYAGSTMYETSVLQCKAAFPDGCSTAIVVGREGWQDALASAGLAGILGCPILYVEADRVPDATAAELERLGVSRIVAVGGPARIGERLVKSWRASGIEVEWLWGDDCLGTQMAVYRAYEGSWGRDAAIIATSTHFADALCVSPAAYRLKAPIFLADPAGNLPAPSSRALSSCGARDYVAVGGPAVLSDRARSAASSLASSSGGSYEWLWGQDMYGTSSAIASWAAGEAGVLSWDGVAFATGRQPYDALSGSVLQGMTGSVMLVADGAGCETVDISSRYQNSIASVRFFGGKRALVPDTRFDIALAFNKPVASLPRFKVYIDAGHGFDSSNNGVYDSGACANGYVEAELNNELANEVGRIIAEEYGIDSYVNDDGGWYKLRHAEAVALDCDALISIHFNTTSSGRASGTESFIHTYNAAAYSKFWQEKIHSRLVGSLGLVDRGMKTDQLAVVSGSCPSVLLEICYINNPSDMSRYQSNKAQVAAAIAEGIVA